MGASSFVVIAKRVGALFTSILLIFGLAPAAAFAQDRYIAGSAVDAFNANAADVVELDEQVADSTALQSGESGLLGTMAASPSGYTWPLRAAGSISQGYSWNGSNGHGGIDIAIGRGSDVLASMGGTVKYVQHYNARTSDSASMASYGNLVILYHPNGTTTYYAHMQDVAVSQGQQVSQGQVVGHVGLTGNTSGYHLHFELRTGATSSQSLSGQGTRQNPLKYVNSGYMFDGSSSGNNPVGAFDLAQGKDGAVYVAGWAFDPDNSNASLSVHVYIGGPAGSGEGHAIAANGPRSDVNSAYRISGNHGFSATISTGKRGSVPIFIYAINVGSGSNALIADAKTVTVSAAKASNTVNVSEGSYAIRSKLNPLMGLDVAGCSPDDKANVWLYRWNDAQSGPSCQKFQVKAAGDGSYYIIATHSSKAVEVYGASMAGGGNISQFKQNQATCQRWFFDKNSDGSFCIRNKASDLNMDVQDAKTSNGTNIQQWYANGHNAQRFFLVPTDVARWSVSVPAATRTYSGKAWTPTATVSAGGVAMRQGIDYTVSYKNNVNPGVASVVITGKGAFTGSKTATFTVGQNKVAMHRLYNPWSGEHFYTGNTNEKNSLVKLGWRYEGVGWNAPTVGSDVYRLYNPYTGDHHFTLNVSEKNKCVAAGWRYEGVGWKSGGSVKVYREYNPYASSFYHNYTKDVKEHSSLCSIGWKNEGVGWYGV